jgi:serine/threonine protein kinase/formylglycine-generating enzyme required for sulfatase activity
MNDPERTGDYQPGSNNEPTIDFVPAARPQHIGRYRIEKVLGQGGFGLVYLAHDDQLQRLVAIKVPHRRLVDCPGAAEAYLTEGRTVANLDHPHFVPVFDVGSTGDCPCYVVSKYIDGTNLATRLKQSRLGIHEAVELVATVAEALHHAHKQGLVHRDIKPGNILLDRSGKPFVADFGLALREQDVGKGPRYAGTPGYMSPEQASGEGHRVDGRSDIFSLGVVFYELLVGRKPFRADSQAGLLEQVTSFEARPPRQFDEGIPKELDRICLKALSKRASERYSTAKDMADDLRHWFVAECARIQPRDAPLPKTQTAEAESLRIQLRTLAPAAEPSIAPVPQSPSTPIAPSRSSTPATTPTSDHQAIKIVPKGLRSFDEHDADFFLELLPGPRDREGMPDSLRFWKTRIEEKDADNTFSVGLIYGPSGCGKSSLVKAGLLPRLSNDVIAVYVEATAEETESRLLNGLRKRCVALPDNLTLKAKLTALRRAQGIPVGKKVVIVLDQFEQWLHAKKEEENTELVHALRQCDGGRVQCIVMVRDDFWMAATRFMRELEVRLLEGQNSAAVDLFPIRHAEKVLTAFGRAFGVLLEGDRSKDQKEFLTQAVSGLAQEGKVICVRLALFAEMMKGKTWTPASLKAVGGTEGVGVTFLEETFSAATAPPEHRYHQKAARAVLKALLPESGSDIKGHLRSYAELLAASGYSGRSRDFEDLLRILDSEVRLITPTDLGGNEEAGQERRPTKCPGPRTQDPVPSSQPAESPWQRIEGEAAGPNPPALAGKEHALGTRYTVLGTEVAGRGSQMYFQLTHDYLVPSLRAWLTRKQKETRRGRAELLLADRASVWSARPENRQLPSVGQWVSIHSLTERKNWTPPQRKMMHRATRYHALRGAMLALVVLLLTGIGLGVRSHLAEQANANHAARLVQRILDANIAQVPALLSELKGYRLWADPLLRQEQEQAGEDSRQKLHTSLALLPVDAGQFDFLYERLLEAGPDQLSVMRDLLKSQNQAALVERLRPVLANAQLAADQRLRAACALAGCVPPDDGCWQPAARLIAEQFLDGAQKNPSDYPLYLETLRPIGVHLLAPLAEVFRNPKRSESERSFATSILADYAAAKPELLADLCMDANARQFAVLFPRIKLVAEQAQVVFSGALKKRLEPQWQDPPLDPSWRPPDAAVIAQLEAAQGLMQERFAVCHTLPLADFSAIADKLRPSGYRPTRLRPYVVAASCSLANDTKPASGPLAATVAAVWTRDGRDWQAVYGRSAAEIRQRDQELRKSGYQPVDVAGYLDGKQERYTALWVKSGPEDTAQLYVGISEPQHEAAGWGPLRKQKLEPATQHVFVSTDGQARYSSVWREQSPRATASWNLDAAEYTDQGEDALAVDINLVYSRQYVRDANSELLAWLARPAWLGLYLRSQHPLRTHPERSYASVFATNATTDQAFALDLSPERQVQRAQELLRQGYRPTALSVAAFAKNPVSPEKPGFSAPKNPVSSETPDFSDLVLSASVWHRQVPTEDAKDQLAKRQAQAAVTLLRLGQEEKVWPLLEHQPDPRVRSFLIHALAPLGADPQSLVRQLDREKNVSRRRALLLSLGEYTVEQWPQAQRDVFLPQLLRWYQEDPDPGLHAAAAWLLRQWGQKSKLRALDAQFAKDHDQKEQQLRQQLAQPQRGPGWYVNGQGQTMVVLPGPTEFAMGSPRTEPDRSPNENPHRVRIGRSYAIASAPVTLAQFQRFLLANPEVEKQFDLGGQAPAFLEKFSPEPDCPIILMDWFTAAHYCNWLSKEEGLPETEWCYQPNSSRLYAPGMRVVGEYRKKTGYRLPTEAEWENACRAGAVTSRCYGQSVELLPDYGWYHANARVRSWPVASLKPNDWGLFDVHGNVWNWCQDGFRGYQRTPGIAKEGNDDLDIITIQQSRLLRGGGFGYPAADVRSACRLAYAPGTRNVNFGVRPARTFTP